MPKPIYTLLLLFICGCTSKPGSSCILLATYDGAPFSSSFSFNEDGTFEWLNGLATESEGRYTLKDSIIILDKIGFDEIIKSKRLLIKKINPNSGVANKCVVQVNDDNNVIDSVYIFRVYIDRRNTANHGNTVN